MLDTLENFYSEEETQKVQFLLQMSPIQMQNNDLRNYIHKSFFEHYLAEGILR